MVLGLVYHNKEKRGCRETQLFPPTHSRRLSHAVAPTAVAMETTGGPRAAERTHCVSTTPEPPTCDRKHEEDRDPAPKKVLFCRNERKQSSALIHKIK